MKYLYQQPSLLVTADDGDYEVVMISHPIPGGQDTYFGRVGVTANLIDRSPHNPKKH